MDDKKITIDGKEYTLVNIKSIKFDDDSSYSNKDSLSENILLIPEILDKGILNLSIQIDKYKKY